MNPNTNEVHNNSLQSIGNLSKKGTDIIKSSDETSASIGKLKVAYEHLLKTAEKFSHLTCN